MAEDDDEQPKARQKHGGGLDDGPGDHYRVGYRKPPKHGQFSAERQPVKRGKRGQARSPLQAMTKMITKPVQVTDKNGQKRKMPQNEVIMQQIINSAANGDAKARELVMKNMIEIDKILHARGPTTQELMEEADAKRERSLFLVKIHNLLADLTAQKKIDIIDFVDDHIIAARQVKGNDEV